MTDFGREKLWIVSGQFFENCVCHYTKLIEMKIIVVRNYYQTCLTIEIWEINRSISETFVNANGREINFRLELFIKQLPCVRRYVGVITAT